MMTTRRGCLYTKLFNKKTNEKHLVQSDNLPASEIGLCIRYMCFGVCVCVCELCCDTNLCFMGCVHVIKALKS